MPVLEPPELSNYHLLDLIGCGGMGSVYIAYRRNYSGRGLLYRLQVTFLNDKTEPFKRPNAEHELPDNLLFGDATDCFVA